MKHFWIVCVVVISLLVPSISQAQCLSGGMGTVGTVFKSTGDMRLDRYLNNEANLLYGTFGVKPNLFSLNDANSANAFADCQNNRLLIGLRLLKEELWGMSQGEMAVSGIMAHEFAHIYQCRHRSTLSRAQKELQADFLAGWYLGHVKNVPGFAIRGFASSLWKKGDFNFRNPDHHGTPKQRVDMMVTGYKSSKRTAWNAYLEAADILNGATGKKYIPRDDFANPGKKKVLEKKQRLCKYEVACQHPVACRHTGPCVHRSDCSHRGPCQHRIPCSHIIMTPYGRRPAHRFDTRHPYDQMHPYHSMHKFDTAHKVDAKHKFDIETRPCK